MKSLLPKRKNKKKLPVQCICRNCDTKLAGRYCHYCGQDLFAGSEKTVGEILYNTADTVFAWDNKIFLTIKNLIFYPGKLTKDFFAGRVIQYVYPAKLFWFITILFFATLNLGDQMDEYTDDDDDDPIAEATVKNKPVLLPYTDTPAEKPAEKPDEKPDENPDENPQQVSPAKKEMKDSQIVAKVKQHFVDYMPYAVLLLMPFFALLLHTLFYKKKKYYASHMIFTLHFHSFVFLFFTLYILVYKFIPEAWESAVLCILLLWPAAYLIIALHVAYRPSILKLIWKIPVIMLTYGIVCLTALVLFILAVVRIVEITQDVNILN